MNRIYKSGIKAVRGILSSAGRRCLVCSTGILPAESAPEVWLSGLCIRCSQKLKRDIAGYCPDCGMPLGSAASGVCADCLVRPRVWSRFFFYGPYQGLLRDLISAYKFKGRISFGRLLQNLACAAVSTARGSCLPDLIVPVPLHPRRLARRGFNQSLELAGGPARLLDIPVMPKALCRIRNTVAQTELPRLQREKNIRFAFRTKDGVNLQGKHILLVDDVLTTGATLEECCTTLQAAGVAQVDVLVVARTLL